jgi:phosphonate transport system substrate-binding protein
MAENTELFCQDVAAYLGKKLALDAEYVAGIPWQERERRFDDGEIQVLWLCGLPYVQKAQLPQAALELLAVPVAAGRRYQNRPIYFSDVVVHGESSFQCFVDLRRRTWAYNEPRSHSGYNIVRAHVAKLGGGTFFSRVVESGAHMNSLQMILDGRVDGAAVDSTVLEWAWEQRPELDRLRVIATLGPSPVPPWVVSKCVPVRRRRDLRSLLLAMHCDRQGREILERGRIIRFEAANDRDYDPIRRMAEAAEGIALRPS